MTLCDTMIHVNENLDQQARNTLEEKMRMIDGVIAPRFNPGKAHLLLISFNSQLTTAQRLLETVHQQGYHAQLVGL